MSPQAEVAAPGPLVVTWHNFRGFQHPTTLRLPRITLLIGRNNVGKTSAYAPLLLLRQTLDAHDPKTALLSRGGLIDAGSYKDFVTRHEVDRKVTFNLSFPESTPEWSPGRENLQPGGIELTFDSVDGNIVRLQRQRILDKEMKSLVTRTRERDSDSFTVTSRLLPTSASVGRPLKEVTELRSAMRDEQPEGFLFEGYGGLLLPRSWRENADRWSKVRLWFNAVNELLGVYQVSKIVVLDLLRSIAYIGPLRSLPLRTYRLAAELPGDVGREGQHAPELLYRLRESELCDKINIWLERLGYGSLEFESLGEDYFQVFVKTKHGLKVNIAHSGVGLSQLLPLLVQGAMAGRNATLIAQQPEIHLNPAQQSLVTDFLIDVAENGRRVVVETHSEHVLLRLRRRIAEGALSADDVAVYYFDNKQGEALVERVPLSESGDIARESWPSGFFEEQLTDSFALAMAQSRGSAK